MVKSLFADRPIFMSILTGIIGEAACRIHSAKAILHVMRPINVPRGTFIGEDRVCKSEVK
jgi:hypothetical protein